MPAVIPFIPLIAGGVTATTGLVGAHEQASAAADAATIQAQAQKAAADDQLKANEEALAFERQQAQYQAQQDEVNRRANYDQWAAHQGKVGSIGEALGLGGVTIPAYVPGITPDFGTMAAGGATAAAAWPLAPSGAPMVPNGPASRPGYVPNRPMPATVGAALAFQPSAGMSSTIPLTAAQPIDPATGRPYAVPPNPYASFGAYLGA